MPDQDYVHGYSERETRRLFDQAGTLTELLHGDTIYSAGSAVLEAGCGVGAQTGILARNSPQARITSIDISPNSLAQARDLVERERITNVEFLNADIFNLPFPDEAFDHIFVCFVLEHLPNPREALANLRRVLKKGGSITVIEGDHGSAYFHPETAAAVRAIRCLVDIQASLGGNSLIGRQLYPLLTQAGYRRVCVSPRMVYVDESNPALVEGFTRNTFTAMVEGVREQALARGLIDAATFDQGVRDLYRTAEPGGTFCYTFFKAIGAR